MVFKYFEGVGKNRAGEQHEKKGSKEMEAIGTGNAAYISRDIPTLDEIKREKSQRQARFLAAVAGAAAALVAFAGTTVGIIASAAKKNKAEKKD